MLKEILEKIQESDGGYGDLGVIPTAPNPAVKDKKDAECDNLPAGELKDKCKKGEGMLKSKIDIDHDDNTPEDEIDYDEKCNKKKKDEK